MQKKLYKVMTILVSCTVLFFLLVAGSLGYSTYQRFTKNELKSAAKLVAAGNNKPSEMADILERSVEYDVRVTFIDAQGDVKYDSEADPAKMENHSDREEFKEAMANGEGESTRFSKTLDTNAGGVRRRNNLYHHHNLHKAFRKHDKADKFPCKTA